MRLRFASLLAVPLVLATLGACTSEPTTEAPIDAEDANLDYRSPVGKEFDVEGDAIVKLEGADAELTGDARLAKAAELARRKIDIVTKALDAELWRIWPEERRQREKKIVAMVRMAPPQIGDLRARDARADVYSFAYAATVAGPNELLELLPLERDGERRTMKLTLADEELVLAWSAAPITGDAYPRYAEMFEDGLDIAIHVGGDHYEPRNDLNESQAIYAELERMGLRSPVASFQDLKLDSGAFKGSLDVGGRSVEIRATLVHADMAPDDQLDKLTTAFKTAASTADVVIYRGHAGTRLDYSGVVVHYNPRVAIPASEFKDLDLPQKYQLFVFDGCETYTGYADKLYEHPNKDEKNADVITSVNYGSALVRAESVRSLLHALLDKTNGRWIPRSWDTVLKGVNDQQRGPWTSIYGVHGLADNPKLSMLTDPSKTGTACRSTTDCGAADSLCVTLPTGRVCGAACTDDSACAEGSICAGVRSQALGPIKQCVPRPTP